MCINEKISINTFLFGVFSVGLALGNNTISLLSAIYYISFISMQLIEYFAWKYLDRKNIIKILSILGLILITLQSLLYILAYMKPSPRKKLLLWLYLLFVLLVICLIPYYNIEFTMRKASNGHLAWDWLNFPIWIILIGFSFMFYVMLDNKEYTKLLVWFPIIAYIYYLYRITGTWGSIWCWIANGLCLILLYDVFKKSIDKDCILSLKQFKC